MTIPLAYGIFIVAKKFINISLIMIWLLFQQCESIMKQLGRLIMHIHEIKLYNNQLIINLSFSLYSCSWDKTVRCFDIESGKEIVYRNPLFLLYLNNFFYISGKEFMIILLQIVKYHMMTNHYVRVLI